MILILGCALGLGALLCTAPILWPPSQGVERERRPLFRGLSERMRQSGLGSVPLPMFLTVSAVVALTMGALVFVVVPVIGFAVAVGATSLMLPAMVTGWRARAIRKARRATWPDVVDHLVSAIRSGLALPDAVAALAESGPESTRAAFAIFARDYATTAQFTQCLDRLKVELADPVADRILETLRMSREVGGNELPKVLRALSGNVRTESAIRGEVEARQSWVMNAARLGAVAPWVVLALLSTRSEAVAAFNSPAGIVVIVGGLIATVVAYRTMIAIARLPEEQRWFG